MFFVEPSRVTITPKLQEASIGEMAIFSCGGVGSFIRINWRFNHSLTCNSETCNSDLLSYGEEVSVVAGDNHMIDSMLTINTSRLGLSLEQDFIFNIECEIEQTIPEEIDLQGENRMFFTILRVQPIGKCFGLKDSRMVKQKYVFMDFV